MTDTKFTPAPWSVHNTADVFTGLGASNAEGIDAASNDGWHVADCDMGGLCLEEVRANADLIAAAPDMYEALADLVHDFEGQPGFGPAKKALAKARGES